MELKKENKKFKSNSTYITHFVIYIIGISLAVWVLFRLTNSTEQELINRYSEQELIGGASQRGAQALQRMLINKFGKFGLVAIPLIGIIGLLNVLLKELFEFSRFLKKSKLFRVSTPLSPC
jgi:nitric oxide reductase large subunit